MKNLLHKFVRNQAGNRRKVWNKNQVRLKLERNENIFVREIYVPTSRYKSRTAWRWGSLSTVCKCSCLSSAREWAKTRQSWVGSRQEECRENWGKSGGGCAMHLQGEFRIQMNLEPLKWSSPVGNSCVCLQGLTFLISDFGTLCVADLESEAGCILLTTIGPKVLTLHHKIIFKKTI